MSANLAERFRLRRPQRFPVDETLPDGTPAIDAGTRPNAFRRFLDSQQNAPVNDSADEQSAPAVERPRRFADLLNQPAQLASVTAPVDSPSGPYVTPDDGQPTLPERPSRFLDFALKAPTTADDPLTRSVQPVPTVAVRDPRQAAIDKRDALLADRNPQDKNGRGRSALKAAIYGALAGLSTGGIGGALGGAVEGGIHGAVAPNLDERRSRDREINRLSQGVALSDAEQHRALEQRQGTANYNKTLAETQDVLGRPEREAAKARLDAQKEERVRVEVERHNRELEKYQGTSQEDSRKRAEETTRHNRRMEEIGRMTAEATAGRFDTDRADKFDRETYDDTIKQIDRDNQSAKERYTAAQKAVGELRTAIKAGQAAAAKVNNPHGIWNAQDKMFYGADPNDIARYREEYEKAQSLVNTLGSSVRQNYGDLVDDDPDMKLPILLKPEPTPKAYPQRQPPAKRTSSSATQYVDAEAYAKDNKITVEKARELIRAHGYEPAN